MAARERGAEPPTCLYRSFPEFHLAGTRPFAHWRADLLGQLRAPAQIAVPALIAALKDEDARVRGNAANSLALLRPAAKEAIPALEEAAREGVPHAEDALHLIRRR